MLGLQAIIHLESIQPQPKRIDYLDSLVDKFIVPTIDTSTVASIDEREELSSIFLEVINYLLCTYVLLYNAL